MYDKGVVPSVIHGMAKEDEAALRAEIFRSIGNYGDFQPWEDRVIGATYIPPKQTAGGIIIADVYGNEQHKSRLEGKAFMLISFGPSAFPDNLLSLYGGERPKIGSWFCAVARDGWEIGLQFPGASSDNRLGAPGWPCRSFHARDVIGPIPHPSCIV